MQNKLTSSLRRRRTNLLRQLPLAGHLTRTYEGMMIAIPEEEWTFFRTMILDAFNRTLQQLAGNINLAKYKKHNRGPKKKMSKRAYDKKKPHVQEAVRE